MRILLRRLAKRPAAPLLLANPPKVDGHLAAPAFFQIKAYMLTDLRRGRLDVAKPQEGSVNIIIAAVWSDEPKARGRV